MNILNARMLIDFRVHKNKIGIIIKIETNLYIIFIYYVQESRQAHIGEPLCKFRPFHQELCH